MELTWKEEGKWRILHSINGVSKNFKGTPSNFILLSCRLNFTIGVSCYGTFKFT